MKKITYLFAFLLLSLNIQGQVELSRGLQAYFPFNGNAKDASNANNLSDVSGASLAKDKNGNDDRAYFFNGINSHIGINHSSLLDFDIGEAFAISLWFKAEQAISGNMSSDILSKWVSASTGIPYSYTIRVTTQLDADPGEVTVARFDSNNSGCGNVTVIRSEPIYNDDQWHNVIMQLTEENKLEMYIDCELIGSVDDMSSCTLESDSSIILGKRTGSSQPYHGFIDELRIYDRSLTLEERDYLCSVVNSVNTDSMAKDIAVYPNPTVGRVNIKNNSTKQVIESALYAIDGKLVSKTDQLDFYIEGPEGIYLLIVKYDDGTISTHQVLKNHLNRL